MVGHNWGLTLPVIAPSMASIPTKSGLHVDPIRMGQVWRFEPLIWGLILMLMGPQGVSDP